MACRSLDPVRGARRLVALCAAVLVTLSVHGPADAQTPAATGTGSDNERAIREMSADMSRGRLYVDLCPRVQTFLDKAGAISDPLLSELDPKDPVDRAVLDALRLYCSTGRFQLGTSRTGEPCSQTLKLTANHRELIQSLMLIRPSAERINLECVAADRRMQFWDLHGTYVLIINSELDGLDLVRANLSGGLMISGGTIAREFRVLDATMGARIEIRDGAKIGQKDAKRAVAIQNSTLGGAIEITDATFEGGVSLFGNIFKGELKIAKSTINGDLQLRGVPLGGDVQIREGTRITGHLNLSAIRSQGGVRVANAAIGGNLWLSQSQIADRIDIDNDTQIGGNLDLTSARAELLAIDNTTVKGITWLNYAQFASAAAIGTGARDGRRVALEKGAFLRQLKTDRLVIIGTDAPRLILSNSTLGSVLISDVKLTDDLFAGNLTANNIDVSGSTIPTFDCTDCQLEQYLLLAATFSKSVRLWGSQIKGQLRLRENTRTATWLPGAILDLRGAQIHTISADDTDLQIKREGDATGPPGLVTTLLGGARIEQVVPGYLPPDQTQRTRSLIDREPSAILAWIRDGNRGAYDPRPYQTIATMLERAGHTDAAKTVRIGKIDDELADRSPSIITRAIYLLGKHFTGYGYRNEQSVWAFLGLAAIGFGVFYFGRATGEGAVLPRHCTDPFSLCWYGVWFSIDRAVPALALDTFMNDYSVLKPWARHYFYMHRAFGTLIISFFIAGLTGVFQ